ASRNPEVTRTQPRDRAWRPGGQHKDPRARFEKKPDRGDRPFAAKNRKPFTPTERKPFQSAERKPFQSTDRKPFPSSDRKPFPSADRKPFKSTDRKPRFETRGDQAKDRGARDGKPSDSKDRREPRFD